MIQSMTGYGKTVLHLPTKKITIEIKSLNSKNLDLGVRIPSYYKEKELEIRQTLAKELSRGKVEFSIYIENTAGETSNVINTGVVQTYIKQLNSIESVNNTLEIAMRLPDVLQTAREELNLKEWKEIKKGIEEAIGKIQKYRLDEGEVLKQDFEKRILIIADLKENIGTMAPERVHLVRERLRKSIDDLKVNVDENRFEQELIFYLEKLDITEELVRLKNHLEYFSLELNSEKSNGKKLGFITQEIGREINTIGSKSNYAPMQKLVIQMKDELEKIKEQNLNVL